jgi:hypothetical protein
MNHEQSRIIRLESGGCRDPLAAAQRKPKLLGEMLLQAGLLTPAQLEVVLRDQQWQPDLRIGDILELRGWVKRDAIEFFAEQWPKLAAGGREHPIGYYFQQAGLLNSQQIEALLQEQAKSGLKIGSLAVLRGWIAQETLDCFLQSLAPQELASAAFIKRKQANGGSLNRHAAPAGMMGSQAQSRSSTSATKPPAQASPQPEWEDIPWDG